MPYSDQEKQNAYQRQRYHDSKEEVAPRRRATRDYRREAELRRAKASSDPDYAAKQKAYQATSAKKRVRKAYRDLKDDHRLRLNVSFRVRQSLGRAGKGGVELTKLLGYDMLVLRGHLERQFLKGMGWHNRSDWHIDHIRPVSSFNIKAAGDDEFRACWALSNLRPIWAHDNLKKSSSATHLI